MPRASTLSQFPMLADEADLPTRVTLLPDDLIAKGSSHPGPLPDDERTRGSEAPRTPFVATSLADDEMSPTTVDLPAVVPISAGPTNRELTPFGTEQTAVRRPSAFDSVNQGDLGPTPFDNADTRVSGLKPSAPSPLDPTPARATASSKSAASKSEPAELTRADRARSPLARPSAPQPPPSPSPEPEPELATVAARAPAPSTPAPKPLAARRTRPPTVRPARSGPSETMPPDADEAVAQAPAAVSRDYTMVIAIAVGVVVLLGATFALVRKLSRDAAVSPPTAVEIPIAVPPRPPPPVVAAPEPEPEPEPDSAAANLGKLGGKRVVLEYDLHPANPASPQPPPAPIVGADPETVSLSREAYHRGNLKLVAGDPKGAEDEYREALKIYPGYVAAYRGLGESYSEKGDRKNALKAFKLYVKTVPDADDVALIKKRIEKLQKK